jgi:hypothetical protein
MARRFEQFLRRFPVRAPGPMLGRAFSVTRETWKVTDDPTKVRPRRLVLTANHTASEAADFARFTAESFEEHGFHKPSGAWWASDGTDFHRYAVHAGRRGPSAAVLITSGVAGLALAAFHFRPKKPGRTAEAS